MASVPVAVRHRHVTLHRPADPDAVLDLAVARESAGLPTNVPYWAAAWESADALAALLPEPTPHATLLDLGCGTGQVGLVAAEMGYRVTLADHEPQALLFARLNTLHLGCDVRRVDWNTDVLPTRFDVIAGSDVLYDRTQWEAVTAFCDRHLERAGTLLLGEPGRPTADAFAASATSIGWHLTQTMHGKIRIFRLSRLRVI